MKKRQTKEAITRFDLRKLKGTGITIEQKGISTGRLKNKEPKRKGRRKGPEARRSRNIKDFKERFMD